LRDVLGPNVDAATSVLADDAGAGVHLLLVSSRVTDPNLRLLVPGALLLVDHGGVLVRRHEALVVLAEGVDPPVWSHSVPQPGCWVVLAELRARVTGPAPELSDREWRGKDVRLLLEAR